MKCYIKSTPVSYILSLFVNKEGKSKILWLRILRSKILPEHRWWRSGKNVIMRTEHAVLWCELEDRDLIEWRCTRSHMTSVQFSCAPRKKMYHFNKTNLWHMLHLRTSSFLFFVEKATDGVWFDSVVISQAVVGGAIELYCITLKEASTLCAALGTYK